MKVRIIYGLLISIFVLFSCYPIYIDNGNLFRKNNRNIPFDERMHTFLLDENNKVILVGSPLKKNRTYNVYQNNDKNYQKKRLPLFLFAPSRPGRHLRSITNGQHFTIQPAGFAVQKTGKKFAGAYEVESNG